jgi:hypothetical protein
LPHFHSGVAAQVLPEERCGLTYRAVDVLRDVLEVHVGAALYITNFLVLRARRWSARWSAIPTGEDQHGLDEQVLHQG